MVHRFGELHFANNDLVKKNFKNVTPGAIVMDDRFDDLKLTDDYLV